MHPMALLKFFYRKSVHWMKLDDYLRFELFLHILVGMQYLHSIIFHQLLFHIWFLVPCCLYFWPHLYWRKGLQKGHLQKYLWVYCSFLRYIWLSYWQQHFLFCSYSWSQLNISILQILNKWNLLDHKSILFLAFHAPNL